MAALPEPLIHNEPVIRMQGVRRTFRMGEQEIHAVDNVTFDVMPGEFVAIIGASGSGKSTMLNLLGCLDTPSSGAYSLRGQQVDRLDDDELAAIRNREIGFVFQDFNLLPRLSAAQNVELPLVYGRVPPVERRQRAEAILKTVGLADRTSHRPDQLSGGQRQRVAIARALVHVPAMLLADEPTGNLDSETSNEIMQLFEELFGLGNTIVMVTHDPEIAARAGRLIEMCDGKISRDETCDS